MGWVRGEWVAREEEMPLILLLELSYLAAFLASSPARCEYLSMTCCLRGQWGHAAHEPIYDIRVILIDYLSAISHYCTRLGIVYAPGGEWWDSGRVEGRRPQSRGRRYSKRGEGSGGEVGIGHIWGYLC